MEAKEQEWLEEKRRLTTSVTRLNNSIKKRIKTKHIGRNKMRRTNYDGYDFANTGNILIYLKWTMMPHHKFWHKSWKEFLPKKKDSFFMQIVSEIDMPDDEDPELY